jgi:hypothetical protein
VLIQADRDIARRRPVLDALTDQTSRRTTPVHGHAIANTAVPDDDTARVMMRRT